MAFSLRKASASAFGLSLSTPKAAAPPQVDASLAAAAGAPSAEERELASALAAHFGEVFVSRIPSSSSTARSPVANDPPASEDAFVAVCSREGSQASLALKIVASDCLAGIFERRLQQVDLEEMRQEAGMAEFGWPGFLRLVACALRGEAGCSAAIEVAAAAAAGGDAASATLTMRFKLEAAALVSRVRLLVAPDGSPSAGQSYLKALQRLTLRAVAAASAGAASRASGGGMQHAATAGAGLATSTLGSLAFPGLTGLPGSTLGYGTYGRELGGFTDVAGMTAPVGASAAAAAASASETSGAAAGAPAASKPATAKKRLGGSLVDPAARRPRPGSNPFQLKR
eukprot:TRINITY_DN48724_c0_g1_i1.p1 TRINITY_DN48724_c0_g1~~TRINITY_DN48724_c0_g1_i1.p1  ORF type:complete len:342 (-),score=75.71 TRINITY_DN48724_c0_g1_i1:326-1351(-)